MAITTAREDGTELFAICVDLETGKVVHDTKVFQVEEPQSEYPDLNSHGGPNPGICGVLLYFNLAILSS